MDESQFSGASRPARSDLWLLLLIGGIVGGLMALAVILMGPGRNSASQFRFPTSVPDLVTVGEAAPEFSAVSPQGQQVSLSDFRGSVVAVNFWATWCGPCRIEMPALQEATDTGKIKVLAVNVGESADTVTAYMDELGLAFTAVLDPDGEIVDLYGIHVFPTTVWVDSEGIVRAEHLGILTQDLIDQYARDIGSQ